MPVNNADGEETNGRPEGETVDFKNQNSPGTLPTLCPLSLPCSVFGGKSRITLSIKQLEEDPLLETLDKDGSANPDSLNTRNSSDIEPLPGLDTIFQELLQEDGNLRQLKYVDNFHQYDLSFKRHCEKRELPNYVVIEPSYFDILTAAANDNHPSLVACLFNWSIDS
ncbi:hypothetical protein REPUB_Repub17cG0026200 [Reevesia pubescens]